MRDKKKKKLLNERQNFVKNMIKGTRKFVRRIHFELSLYYCPQILQRYRKTQIIIRKYFTL